jgi:hypothetical protein
MAEARSFAEANSHGRWDGAAAEAALLAATADDGLEAHARASADVERANALWAVEFVSRDGSEVEIPLVDVDFDLAGGLRDVRMEEDLVCAAKLAYLLHRLDDADFVVDRHY